MMTAEEFGAALFALERRAHEERIAEIRGWLELAQAENRTADVAFHQETIARLESFPKPWEKGNQRR